MVLLTMTGAAVEAIEYCSSIGDDHWLWECSEGPSLLNPAVGQPIAHGQLIAVSKYIQTHLRKQDVKCDDQLTPTPAYHLHQLLQGARIYVEPQKARAAQTSEYKALMARLRKEEEAREYERMINPPPRVETFAERFPNSSPALAFSSTSQLGDEEDDEVTYADINRQVALIINILVSIIACSVALWMVASSWSTPTRLGLSMGGSGMIGVAEVVVYAGYLRRVKEAKGKAKKEVEMKEIINTWVIGGKSEEPRKISTGSIVPKKKLGNDLRRRTPRLKG